MINFEKLCHVMMWEQYDGETHEDTFLRQEIKAHELPPTILVDVVHANGLEGWAKSTSFKSMEDLKKEIVHIFKLATIDKINSNKKMQELFAPIYNFCVYATRTDRNGRIRSEALKIAESAWWGEIAQAMLKEKTDKLFNVEPCPVKYAKASRKIQKIWNFSNVEIDAFRYFVCQTRHAGHNPSMNKSIYLWSGEKQTGKTTVARSIAAVLNGEESITGAGKFESTFNKELQINDHDLPYAAQFNCVILDEAMPKDSRKSYGRVKSMLTSNTCSFNQKYGRIMSIEAKRYYLYTSNEDISDFIQDSSERRFIQIKMDRIPVQISFDEIYNLWKDFAQNCTPEDDWQKWYNTFEDVDGLMRKDMSEYKSQILNSSIVINTLKDTHECSLTMRFFEDLLIRGKVTRDEKTTLKNAVNELFGESKDYRWSKKVVLEELLILIEKDGQEVDGSEKDLPF